MAPRMIGQIKVITTQMKMANTSIWTMSVTVIFTRVSSANRVLLASRLADRNQERVLEREEQREADAHERDRVEQAGDDEHLHLQGRGQFRLARGAFQELAAEQAEADGGSERAHAEDDADGESGETLNVSNISKMFHDSSNLNLNELTTL